MVELFYEPKVIANLLHLIRIMRKLWRQCFERNVDTTDFIVAPVNGSHATSSKLPGDPISSEEDFT